MIQLVNMKLNLLEMKQMTTKKQEYVCIKDNTIQNISRKTAELEARADYKDKRIDEMNHNMELMNNKLDQVLSSFNDLKLESKGDDANLELRLKTIETKLETQEETTKENHNRLTLILSVVAVGLTIVTILINVYFNLMH